MAGEGMKIGLYGFGAAAHIIAQVARWQGREVFAFTRPGDAVAQAFARKLGASWAGSSEEKPPEPLDCAVIYAPVGALVPAALSAVRKGGRVVCAGIHMSDIPAFPYRLLWEERELLSVANLTRSDGDEFFAIARMAGIRTETVPYPTLGRANDALADLRIGTVSRAPPFSFRDCTRAQLLSPVSPASNSAGTMRLALVIDLAQFRLRLPWIDGCRRNGRPEDQ